jgi:two-component system KDP operon response regulator KdpE
MSTQIHPATILVIDDEVQMRRLLRRILEEQGHKVLAVDTGVEGLAHAGTDRPDVIVLDLGLPDMDGVEVLKELRSRSSVPILILSVRDAEETIVKALDGGADDYLTKPFRTGELLARIRALLRHRVSGQEDLLFASEDLTRPVTHQATQLRITLT